MKLLIASALTLTLVAAAGSASACDASIREAMLKQPKDAPVVAVADTMPASHTLKRLTPAELLV